MHDKVDIYDCQQVMADDAGRTNSELVVMVRHVDWVGIVYG